MKELELKFLEVDKVAIVEKLKAVGARLLVDAILRTVYFDTPDGKIKKANELLRLRTFGDKLELCFKKNMRIEDGCKVYDETETHVSDFDATVEILGSLGYFPAISYEKKRTEYMLDDGTKFEIDEFHGVPVFVEVEAVSSRRIEEIAATFDLNEYERSHLTGEELLKQKYKIELNGLRF